MSSVWAALPSPGHTSPDNFDSVPEHRRHRAMAGDGVRITEVINNPTWGMSEYLPPVMPNPATSMSYSDGGCDPALDLAGPLPTSPVPAYNFVSDMVDFAQMQQQRLQRQNHIRQQQQPQQSYYQPPPLQADQHWEVQQGQKVIQMHSQQQQDQADKVRSARRYSEALQRHHAGPLMSHLMTTNTFLPNGAERPGTDESEPTQSRNGFAFYESGLLDGGVLRGWHRNGQGYHLGQRLPIFEGGLEVDMPVSTVKQACQGQIRQPKATQHLQIGNGLTLAPSLLAPTTRPSRAPCWALPRAETFAGMIPGLKHESNGTMMPFTGVLTPIDGFGSFGE
jgi:hypothetical protein